ncbi:hypothetical protein KY284_003305 [Solanum tuberosum]|nr:hypothetical protein KY284_003305 [Solanum tuberosum]
MPKSPCLAIYALLATLWISKTVLVVWIFVKEISQQSASQINVPLYLHNNLFWVNSNLEGDEKRKPQGVGRAEIQEFLDVSISILKPTSVSSYLCLKYERTLERLKLIATVCCWSRRESVRKYIKEKLKKL